MGTPTNAVKRKVLVGTVGLLFPSRIAWLRTPFISIEVMIDCSASWSFDEDDAIFMNGVISGVVFLFEANMPGKADDGRIQKIQIRIITRSIYCRSRW
mmetsp:Transcript_28612/g.33942  ORF Transcript_28612/g.33942 Transcript_28612/m.33942 type:complete len:98 (-) Transcript_28612:176-469(-)